jgi:hypothetical protein
MVASQTLILMHIESCTMPWMLRTVPMNAAKSGGSRLAEVYTPDLIMNYIYRSQRV